MPEVSLHYQRQSKFWFPKGKTEIKLIISKCTAYKRWISKQLKLPVILTFQQIELITPEFSIKWDDII